MIIFRFVAVSHMAGSDDRSLIFRSSMIDKSVYISSAAFSIIIICLMLIFSFPDSMFSLGNEKPTTNWLAVKSHLEIVIFYWSTWLTLVLLGSFSLSLAFLYIDIERAVDASSVSRAVYLDHLTSNGAILNARALVGRFAAALSPVIVSQASGFAIGL